MKSVLLFGSTGRLGSSVVSAVASHPHVHLHAFTRSPSKVTSKLVASVQAGDALDHKSVRAALTRSKADTAVVIMGIPDLSPTTIRGDSAKVLAKILQEPPFRHVNVVVVSAVGAGGSSIKYKFGIGTATQFVLRHQLADHDVQEHAFLSRLGKDRVMIVRPMGLKNDSGSGVVEFKDVAPALTVDRVDLAHWILKQLEGQWKGRIVHVTGRH